MENKIFISESEYKEFIRFQITAEETEKIIQKRIDDAVNSAVKEVENKWKNCYDALVSDIETQEGVANVFIDKPIYSDTTKVLVTTKDNDLSKLLEYLGLTELVIYKDREYGSIGSNYEIYETVNHYIKYKNRTYYSSRGLENLKEDIRKTVERLNKVKDKMIEIRGLDPEIFDAMTYYSDVTKLDVEEEVTDKSQEWFKKLLKV